MLFAALVIFRVSYEMGNYLTVDMEENYRKNQEFITEMNTVKVSKCFYNSLWCVFEDISVD